MEETRTHKPAPPLDPRALAIIRKMADDYGERYLTEFVLGHIQRIVKSEDATIDTVCNALDDPYQCLQIFFGHYAFARRGRDRDDLASLSNIALHRLRDEHGVDGLLNMRNGQALWETFANLCDERDRRANEPQNRGLLQGMLELAQECFRMEEPTSIAGWIADCAAGEGKLEEPFLRIVDIRGVGPKTTSTFIRDIVLLFGIEDQIEAADKIYIQPIDRWLRAIAKYVIPEPGMEKSADWIVAGKLSKYTRRAGVSGIRFNMGVTYFGQRVVREPERLESELKNLLVEASEQAKRADGPNANHPTLG